MLECLKKLEVINSTGANKRETKQNWNNHRYY